MKSDFNQQTAESKKYGQQLLKEVGAGKAGISKVKRLLAQGASLEETDSEGNTALICAVKHGHTDVALSILEESIIKVDAQNNHDESALFWAVRTKNMTLVKRLLDKKAAVNLPSLRGDTLLHWIAREGPADILKMLLDKDPELNVIGQYGKTPVMWSVEFNKLELVKLFVEKGADLSLEDEQQCTALRIAQNAGYKDIEKYLEQKIEERRLQKIKEEEEKKALQKRGKSGSPTKKPIEKTQTIRVKKEPRPRPRG